MGSNVNIFTGNSHPQLAYDICQYLQLPLSKALVTTFTNGETRVKINENVRGKDVYIVQPTCGNVNDSLMELLLMIDAVKRASAKTLTAVVPYYGYAKQEKKTSGREPISAKLVANLICVAGVDRVITIDLHAAAIQGFFDIPVDNLMFLPILVNYYKKRNFFNGDFVIVSPDAGGVARARTFADKLQASLAIIFKRRLKPDQAEAIDLVGDVRGKTAIIIDDMISTGGTMIEGVKTLKKHGIKKVYACATHPLLAGNAIKDIESSDIEEVVVADTIPIPPDAQRGKFTALSVAPLLGETIRRIFYNLSVSKLFD
ncbi:MAG: ribose-phosphate pyrophosphokinase [Candidatus Eremiobacteraeota bacterium]|nr:ribose-phosphate pyrophosphokinase [Candidatus Eremiobacteraeota bacterium]